MHDFLDPKMISRLAGLPLHARVPMLGSVAGMHRSPIRGSSLEFAEYRKYVPGDDTRRLDWRAYARSDRFYIKEFEADTNLRMALVVDTSGSMDYGDDSTTKLNYARQIAGILAYLTSRQGDAVGLYCAGEGFHTEIPPKRSASHLRNVLDELAGLKAQGPTGLPAALHEAAEKVSQRALIVIISDLFIEPAVLRDCFQHLRFRKHDVAVFHLLEESELAFDFDRPMRFLDMEGGAPMLVDPVVIGPQYQQALTEYLDELRSVIRDAAVDYHRVQIDDPADNVLARFLINRAPKKR